MENKKTQNNALGISARSFITATAVIFALMLLCYILTFIIPGGEYSYTTDANGNSVIDTQAGFKYVDGGIPFFRWLFSPILVLGTAGGLTLIAVLMFLFIIGGAFNNLENSGLMKYMLAKITNRYKNSKYKFLAFTTFFFMCLGSLVGSYEECIPLVPIVVALSIKFGWDALTGLGMSLLAAGCGFAAGVFNPFTVGVAQSLAGLPMFSGISLRLFSFVIIYALLLSFLILNAKKLERAKKTHSADDAAEEFTSTAKLDKALRLFAAIMFAGIVFVVSSTFVTFFQDLTMVVVGIMFLIAGIAAPAAAGMQGGAIFRSFLKGVSSVLPAVAMILMAASIRFTLEESHILGTILHSAVETASSMPKWGVILFIYIIVLVMNFFVASGSAKAFMLIPLIVPIAQIFGISPQLCVLAFAFGDGFSNIFYPTNPVLLISLGLADVSYGRWVKWSLKFQVLNLIITSSILMLGMLVGY